MQLPIRVAPVFAAVIVAVAGCGGKPTLVSVTGKVVTAKGEPVTAGSIWFQPGPGNTYAGEKPSCQLAEDGSFNMRTYPHGDGVPPGSWKVTLSPELANRLRKPQYADPARSPWTIDVSEGGVADKVFEVK